MKWWLTDSAEDLVGDALATAAARYRRGLEGELARRCEENYPRTLTTRLEAAMRKAMDPSLQGPSSMLPFIVEVSEEEAARVAQSGVLVVPQEVTGQFE